jgi:hypothetical protein
MGPPSLKVQRATRIASSSCVAERPLGSNPPFPDPLTPVEAGVTVLQQSQEGGLSVPEHSVARWPKFRPKSSKGAGEKKIWPEEFMAELWPNFVKSGRKVAEEIF